MPGVLSHVHVSDGFGKKTPDFVHPKASFSQNLFVMYVTWVKGDSSLDGEYKAHACAPSSGSQIMG